MCHFVTRTGAAHHRRCGQQLSASIPTRQEVGLFPCAHPAARSSRYRLGVPTRYCWPQEDGFSWFPRLRASSFGFCNKAGSQHVSEGAFSLAMEGRLHQCRQEHSPNPARPPRTLSCCLRTPHPGAMWSHIWASRAIARFVLCPGWSLCQRASGPRGPRGSRGGRTATDAARAR